MCFYGAAWIIHEKKHTKAIIWSTIFSILTISWTCWSTCATSTELLQHDSVRYELLNDENVEEVASDSDTQFHILMILAGCYLAMTFTDWGSINGFDEVINGTLNKQLAI